MPSAARIQAFLDKPVMAAVFFLSGVIWDTLTLTRIDRLLDNLVLLFYLVVLGGLIVVSARTDLNASVAVTSGREGQPSWWSEPLELRRAFPA